MESWTLAHINEDVYLDPALPRKKGRSKKIGQPTQKNLSIRHTYAKGEEFWNSKKKTKPDKILGFAGVCGILRMLCGFLFSLFVGFWGFSFEALHTFLGMFLTKAKNMQSKS